MAKGNFRMIGRCVLVLTCFLSGALAVPNASSADGIVPPVLTAGSDTVHVGVHHAEHAGRRERAR